VFVVLRLLQFTLVHPALAPLDGSTRVIIDVSESKCRCISSTSSSSCSLQFTLVDAALAPFFLRLPVLKHYRDFDLPQVRQGLSFRATHMCGLAVKDPTVITRPQPDAGSAPRFKDWGRLCVLQVLQGLGHSHTCGMQAASASVLICSPGC